MPGITSLEMSEVQMVFVIKAEYWKPWEQNSLIDIIYNLNHKILQHYQYSAEFIMYIISNIQN